MAASMHDVARVAGVSQRTVSNVVNGAVHVSPQTRQRVQEAIAELGFRPNVSAQRLRKGRTGIVGLALPEIAAPYFAELADHLQSYAAQHGITLLVDQTGGLRERELAVLEGYQSTIIDALIFSPLSVSAEDIDRSRLDVPVALIGESIRDGDFLHVSIDNVEAARVATTHLVAGGCRRVAAMGVDLSGAAPGPAELRFRGYRAALRDAGLQVDRDLALETTDWGLGRGYELTVDLLDRGVEVDGLFCFNDTLALGALRALRERRVEVPGDVAVVGWDDVAGAAYAIPSLTSIAPDKARIAELVVDGLLTRLATGRTGTAPVTDPVCPFALVVRESSSRTGPLL